MSAIFCDQNPLGMGCQAFGSCDSKIFLSHSQDLQASTTLERNQNIFPLSRACLEVLTVRKKYLTVARPKGLAPPLRGVLIVLFCDIGSQ